MKQKSLFLMVVLGTVAAVAETPSGRGRLFSGTKSELRTPVLWDQTKVKETLALRDNAPATSQIGTLLPDRVYLYYYPPEKKWLFLLTDGNGDFRREPMEFLRMTSTLPGTKIGAEDKKQFYQLGDDGRWKLTFTKEFYAYWVYSTPPRIKFVEFGTL